MKKILISVKEHIVAWMIGITLVLYPLSAMAAYMKEPGKPIVIELDGTDTRTGEYKIVGTLERPQTRFDNMLADTRKFLATTFTTKERTLTPEERQARELRGQARVLEARANAIEQGKQ
jgi:hypothetical protein